MSLFKLVVLSPMIVYSVFLWVCAKSFAAEKVRAQWTNSKTRARSERRSAGSGISFSSWHAILTHTDENVSHWALNSCQTKMLITQLPLRWVKRPAWNRRLFKKFQWTRVPTKHKILSSSSSVRNPGSLSPPTNPPSSGQVENSPSPLSSQA